MAMTRSRALSEIDAPGVKARETVHFETPANRATSLAVALCGFSVGLLIAPA